MHATLRTLIVEDSSLDAQLVQGTLEQGGYRVLGTRVETADDFRRALRGGGWDLILSDHSLPGFGAMEALRIYREESCLHPFLVVSGTLGEEAAVTVMRAGAHDLILKSQLARLVPAVDREIREAGERRARAAAERAARELDERFQGIVETVQEGIWLIGPDGHTRYVNALMARMLGEPPEALRGRAAVECLDEPYRAEFLRRLAPATAPEAGPRMTAVLRRGDGSTFWATLSVSSLSPPGRPQLEHVACVADITEQRSMQEQLMVSDRMASVGMLAAGVAHEINNPLASVLANLHLAVDELVGPAGPRAADGEFVLATLRDALEGAERVRTIVRDLRIFSRAKEEKPAPVDVREVVESALRMAWNDVRHRARLVRRFDPCPPVLGLESRLGQVLLNLIMNASQAIPEGHSSEHSLEVATGVSQSGRVRIEVKDSGVGMGPEVLARLFTPFFTTKPAGFGTGLGLAISQRIVTEMGGEIEVESRPGQGSTFRVLLPPTALPLRASRRSSGQVAPAPRRGRILAVDDDALLRDVIERILSPEHEVVTLSTGREALAALLQDPTCDVVLCDLMMPEMSGMELHAELLARLPEVAQRMIFITGGAFTPRAYQFLVRTRAPWLEKPFSRDALRAIVNARVAEGSPPPELPPQPLAPGLLPTAQERSASPGGIA